MRILGLTCSIYLVVVSLELYIVAAFQSPCVDQVCDVTKFGAVGDGTHVDTAAVRATAEAVRNLPGGGVMLFPSLHEEATVYLTGAFNLSSHVVLEIAKDVVVKGNTRDKDDPWPSVDASKVWPQFGHGSDCQPGSQSCARTNQASVSV